MSLWYPLDRGKPVIATITPPYTWHVSNVAYDDYDASIGEYVRRSSSRSTLTTGLTLEPIMTMTTFTDIRGGLRLGTNKTDLEFRKVTSDNLLIIKSGLQVLCEKNQQPTEAARIVANAFLHLGRQFHPDALRAGVRFKVNGPACG